ncbi:sigma-54-dependent Fis family transcriptional regulator [Paenibacillus sp.]|uniref:sigma-54-dependent Fis family transcriptional regulator n=1 Tax=Paenibacillus sp. TaxID=58172 RepID=UPI002D41ACD5|nr:sigma-54-dependent Fis family transcriptional regulator [Paenibacillus sp.]HZG84571.1 sigma-54-dependent Fis family transcriptional regulator [Paenibacillus sp.]
MRNKELLTSMWERFIQDGSFDPTLDEVVAQSWQRSVAYGVDPYQEKGQRMLHPRKFAERLAEKKELIDFSLPLMKTLYNLVKDSGFLVILCDEQGFLLKVIGDMHTIEDAEKMNFVEGVSWSEEAMGTNAIGTCIALDRPIQIYAAEHFSRVCQSWTCSASPIHDPEGRIIGVLDMSGPFDKAHPHTLGMVVSAVEAIENQLRLKEKSRKNDVTQSYLEAMTNTLQDGVLILNTAGNIIRTNNVLLHWFGLREDTVLYRHLADVFECGGAEPDLFDKADIVNREVDLKAKGSGRKRPVVLTRKPIHSADGEWMGSLLTVKEMQNVRQLIHDMTGSSAKFAFPDIIGVSPAIQACIREARLAASSHATVLLMGESGTGKDLFAQAIHNESSRRKKPFIAINCGAISRDLLGSELFGYVEGAFTGARKGGSAGKFEIADGGTLFLDEIGEMSLEMQVLLLRVLQEKEIVRIGGHKVIPVDVRIVAATNKVLEDEVRKGTFREDLYYRLNVMPIRIPSLRNRKEDIERLTESFVRKLSVRLQKPIASVSPELLDALIAYDWPGNVRQLQNVLERTIIRAAGATLRPEDLPEELQAYGARETAPARREVGRTPLKDEIKKEALLHSIRQSNGNHKQAAKLLGVSRSTLYRQLEKYNIR